MEGANASPSGGTVEVSVIVPAKNASSTIGRTLEALSRQRDAAFEVIVVDDGSADETVAIATQSSPGAKVLRRERSFGAGSARNHGAQQARGDVLAFTDADCEPAADWLQQGLRALQDRDVVQGRVVPAPWDERSPFERTVSVERETGLYETANLFVRRAAFESVGGFEDWIAPSAGGSRPMGEDVWFAWRARRRGARTAFAADAVVYHAVFPRGGLSFVGERLRLRHFPALARRIPELRSTTFFARVFLNRRSAAFDAAVVSMLLARFLRRRSILLGAAPYGVVASRGARRYGFRRAPILLCVDIAADAVACAALVSGSAKERTALL